ncbi:MAG: sulfatase-like hydrolase/transferase [Verrucomicrobiales bacterium]|nr:sulfatase-like hydrolase/transferase [Verrucomicrobiales bacterium]
MRRRVFGFWLAGLLTVIVSWFPIRNDAASLANTRNILLVVADDVGTDSLSQFNADPNASFPPTPTIDRLSERGIRFRNAYGYPTCSPTRSALLTGRYGFRTGIGAAIDSPGDPQLSPRDFTLAKALQANPQLGFRLAHIGKWHLSPEPTDPNFIGGWHHFSGALEADLDDYFHWTKVVNGQVFAGTTNYATTDNANDAIHWLQAQGTNRWFLWLAFNSAHTPHHKPPNDLHSYDNLPITPPANGSQRRYYESMVEALDTELARVLTAVDLEETTIVVLGDNGTPGQVIQPPFNSANAKGTLAEGGIRIPLIIAGAGVANPDRDSEAVVHVVDLFATLLELAGVDLATTLPSQLTFDSRSFLPILRDDSWNPAETTILAENFGSSIPLALHGVAIRGSRYKLIRLDNGREQFFDLISDALESNNLLGAPASSSNLNASQRAAYNALSQRLTQLHHPTPQPPRISPRRLPDGSMALSVSEELGTLFRLERSAVVSPAQWSTVTNTWTAVDDQNPTVTLFDYSPQPGPAFYRVTATAR